MITKQDKLALLEETATFFNRNNRCEGKDGVCRYFMRGKAGCAIGRLIKDKKLCKKLDAGTDCYVVYSEVFEQLPDNLKAYGKKFLEYLQRLHDNESFWLETGLSSDGKEFVNSIKTRINSGAI